MVAAAYVRSGVSDVKVKDRGPCYPLPSHAGSLRMCQSSDGHLRIFIEEIDRPAASTRRGAASHSSVPPPSLDEEASSASG